MPDFGAPGDHSGRIHRLDGLNAEIGERVAQLRDHVARERPAWAATAGARPDNPVTAQRWDETIGLAAAYRETYRVRTNDASSPLRSTQPSSAENVTARSPARSGMTAVLRSQSAL